MAVWQQDTGLLVALADGAGGVGAGAAAAQTIVDAAAAWTPASSDAGALLRDLDQRLASSTGGQSTAVVLSLSASGVVGASVGDSGAWVIRQGLLDELTVKVVLYIPGSIPNQHGSFKSHARRR